ncbi:hypothetical protein B0H14DRAFT_2624302 [Mycena olivaceomarginata]|nr:hypothetical protein B0H14DRAFT_2624302 [Mycena olivaceomarginata]
MYDPGEFIGHSPAAYTDRHSVRRHENWTAEGLKDGNTAGKAEFEHERGGRRRCPGRPALLGEDRGHDRRAPNECVHGDRIHTRRSLAGGPCTLDWSAALVAKATAARAFGELDVNERNSAELREVRFQVEFEHMRCEWRNSKSNCRIRRGFG